MFKCGFSKYLKVGVLAVAAQTIFASNSFASNIKGEELFSVGGLPITNSMLTTWIFAAIIIIIFRLMLLGGAKLVPSKGQMIIESIITGLEGIFEPLMGKKAFRGAFPLLLGFFSYILMMNWSGLLPGIGSIGNEIIANSPNAVEGLHATEHVDATTGAVSTVYEKFVPYLRPANTDLNTTLALAIISFGAWVYFVFKYAGVKHFLHDTFGNKADKKEIAYPIYISLFFVFFAVGCIDVISIVMRLLSLSFRLFGNTFGGEVLLENMHNLAAQLPAFISWIIPLPFYLLEILIGLLQAFLFTLLTAVYIGLLTNSEESH